MGDVERSSYGMPIWVNPAGVEDLLIKWIVGGSHSVVKGKKHHLNAIKCQFVLEMDQ